MKRSEINRCIREADSFFLERGFHLPPFARWTPKDWSAYGIKAEELRLVRLGWDVTDFHSGKFNQVGLTLFTLRNGDSKNPRGSKVYAEKIMSVRQDQVTPFHYHAVKTEDLINRGGTDTGRLAIQLYNSDRVGGFADTPVLVSCDGVRRSINAGDFLFLGPGESVTVPPYVYHTFYSIQGDSMIGEVSSVNDDASDNYFKDPLPRYPSIEEDEPPFHFLCNEYPKLEPEP